MAWNKKKITAWLAAIAAGIFFFLIFFALIFIGRADRHFEQFQREHADAATIASAAARPLLESGNHPPRPNDAPTSFTQTGSLASELQAIRQEFGKRSISSGHYVGVYAMYLQLPAVDYPDEGTSGTIPCRAALRQKIIDSVAMRESNNRRVMAPVIEKTTVTLSTVMTLRGAAMDHIDRLLSRDDLDWPDPARDDSQTSGVYHRIFELEYTMPLALQRAELQGDPDRITKLLVGLVRMKLIDDFHFCAYPWQNAPVSMQRLDEFLFSAGECGGSAQKGLEQAAALLAGSKLDDKQSAALRAMWVMDQRERLRHPNLRIPALDKSIVGSIIERGIETCGGPVVWALLEPVASGWAAGDEARLQYGLSRLESFSNVQEIVFGDRTDLGYEYTFPAQFSGSSGETEYNNEVERLQVLVAMARFRIASGRYPEDIHELVPQYLDRATIEHKNSMWGIARLPAGTYPIRNDRCENVEQRADNITFQGFVESHRKAKGRLPQSAADLRPFGADDQFIAAHADWFKSVVERPIVFSIHRVDLSRAQVTHALKFGYCEVSSNPDNIPIGPQRLPAVRIIAYWPEPEQYWPEIRELIIKGRGDSRF